MTAEIEFKLSNGYITVIDEDDYLKIKRYKWHARRCKPDLYAARTTSTYPGGRRKVVSIYLHRALLNAPTGTQVDHKNGDTLDNRRRNLELVTPAENLARRRFARR